MTSPAGITTPISAPEQIQRHLMSSVAGIPAMMICEQDWSPSFGHLRVEQTRQGLLLEWITRQRINPTWQLSPVVVGYTLDGREHSFRTRITRLGAEGTFLSEPLELRPGPPPNPGRLRVARLEPQTDGALARYEVLQPARRSLEAAWFAVAGADLQRQNQSAQLIDEPAQVHVLLDRLLSTPQLVLGQTGDPTVWPVRPMGPVGADHLMKLEITDPGTPALAAGGQITISGRIAGWMYTTRTLIEGVEGTTLILSAPNNLRRVQRRRHRRFAIEDNQAIRASIYGAARHQLSGRCLDLSEGGARCGFPLDAETPTVGTLVRFVLEAPGLETPIRVAADALVAAVRTDAAHRQVGLRFDLHDRESQRGLATLLARFGIPQDSA